MIIITDDIRNRIPPVNDDSIVVVVSHFLLGAIYSISIICHDINIKIPSYSFYGISRGIGPGNNNNRLIKWRANYQNIAKSPFELMIKKVHHQHDASHKFYILEDLIDVIKLTHMYPDIKGTSLENVLILLTNK